jgi:exopolysaccharide biosynthesis polyprenyl glycosylphosphotransferase
LLGSFAVVALPDLRHPGGPVAMALTAGVLATVWVVVGCVLGYYDAPIETREPLDDVAIASTMLLATVFTAALLGCPAPQWPQFGYALLACWGTIVAVRLSLFRPASRWQKSFEQVLIVGTGLFGRITGEDLARRGRKIPAGYLSFSAEERGNDLCAPLLGTSKSLEKALRTMSVSEVYFATDESSDPSAVQEAISVCENLGVPFALPAYTFRLRRARPLVAKATADGYLHYTSTDAKIHQRAIKRICDLFFAGTALALLAPLFLLVALLIKVTSRGPVFFRQLRCGMYGKPFYMLKFRSMVRDAEQRRKSLGALNERNGPVFKMRNDPRVTRLGAFLRKYSIDEIPQLINVLRGDMTIVGPRPAIPDEVAEYRSWQLRRLSVRPGLTCIWQTSTGRHQMSFDEWMYLDLLYIDHWNLIKDVSIILRTIPVVLSGSGEPLPQVPGQLTLVQR